jgi:hypothetical protein
VVIFPCEVLLEDFSSEGVIYCYAELSKILRDKFVLNESSDI